MRNSVLQRSWMMSFGQQRPWIKHRANWNGECWLLICNLWKWCQRVPKCTNSLQKESQVSLSLPYVYLQYQYRNIAPTKLVRKYDNYVVYLIAVVETIEKRREPLPAMEAIYLITPNEKTIKELMSDFQSQHRTQYRAAHVYFTEGKFECDASCQLNGKIIFIHYLS